MGLAINSALAVLVIIIGYYTQKQHRRDLKARVQGCQSLRKFPSLEPFFGFDFTCSIHQSLSNSYRFHELYGENIPDQITLCHTKNSDNIP
jgi:hypothetical protein